MNDTTREIGGALGVAILGSITAAVYSSQIAGDPSSRRCEAAAPEAAAAVKDSVGAASIVAAQLPAASAHSITAAANDAFIHAHRPDRDRRRRRGAARRVRRLSFLPAHGPDDEAHRRA